MVSPHQLYNEEIEISFEGKIKNNEILFFLPIKLGGSRSPGGLSLTHSSTVSFHFLEDTKYKKVS